MGIFRRYAVDFPSKIVKRMTPEGSTFNKSQLSVHGNAVYFHNQDLIIDADDTGFFVEIATREGGARVSRERLENLLEHPSALTHAKPETRKLYESIIAKGKIVSGTDSLKVYFRVNRDVGADKVFDAFYYRFKPILRATI